MHVYAHRGVSAHLPENTLAAFARAIELGVADEVLSADSIAGHLMQYRNQNLY